MRTLEQLRRVKMSDMTRDEQRLVVKAACTKLEQEFEAKRPQLEAALASIARQ